MWLDWSAELQSLYLCILFLECVPAQSFRCASEKNNTDFLMLQIFPSVFFIHLICLIRKCRKKYKKMLEWSWWSRCTASIEGTGKVVSNLSIGRGDTLLKLWLRSLNQLIYCLIGWVWGGSCRGDASAGSGSFCSGHTEAGWYYCPEDDAESTWSCQTCHGIHLCHEGN